MPLRLEKLRNGHTFFNKLKLKVFPKLMGFPPSDIIRMFTYRPKYFGNPFLDVVQSGLRGPSFWTVGERELFATYVSACNQCFY